MANIKVVNLGGAKVGEFELLDEVFAAGINDALLWEAVKHYRASLRQGTAATKTRKNVSGAGKKLWKQKGTGRARVGSIRTPLWRGGGTVHGPQPRSYEYQFPKKKLMGALRSAIAAKIADGKFTMVDTLALAEGKTKLYAQALKKLETGKTTLLVESSQKLDEKLYLGSRNLQGVELVLSSEVHPYDLLRYEHACSRWMPSSAAGDAEEGRLQASACRQRRQSGGCIMPTLYTVIRRPLITEKGMTVKETENTLVFEVAEKATKTEVKQAVESLFKIKVAGVRTAIVEGKERRRGKFSGYRPDWKKAYVRLKEGEKMPEYLNSI